jgi:hypothetical protein
MMTKDIKKREYEHDDKGYKEKRARTRNKTNKSQVSECEIFGRQTGTVTGFSLGTSGSSCQYNSTNVPYSSSSTRCC